MSFSCSTGFRPRLDAGTGMNSRSNMRLVAQAKAYTNNLSATAESLLTEFAANQQSAQRNHQHVADACAADWNAVHAAVGSFADEHSPL